MSSAQSTITSNVNLLLVNSSVITLNNPYIAYISSTTVPGRIATVRDATGLVSSPGRLIILSTLKDVLFSDGTSSITISQPFGYISLSSRDKNTWDVINTFAFPQPSPVSYVSSVYATASINANNYLSRSYISTATLTTDSISSYRIQASTISTANLFSQNISTQNLRSFNNIFTNISSQTVSTNSLFASNVSTNTTTSQNVLVSSLTLSNISNRASLTLSNDGQALLVNGIPTGTFRAISTATTTLNMNNNSISNVLNLSISNLSSINISTANIVALNAVFTSLSTFNLRTQNISTNNIYTNNISSLTSWSSNFSSLTINASNIRNANIINTSVIKSDYITANIQPSILFSNTINMNNSNIDNCANLTIQLINGIAISNYQTSNWANYKAKNNLDISNNLISNISQATLLNSVQTNLIMARSIQITTSNSDNVDGMASGDIFTECNVSPFTFTRTGFSNYSFTFQLNGSTLFSDPTGDLIYYFYLSNSIKNTVSYGRNFNSSYLYLQKQNSYFPTRTAFTYSDIFDLNNWNSGDTIYVYLSATNSNSYPISFTDVNLSLVYQPLFS